MGMLVKRNCKIFFRDKSAVFFSLLAVFIIIALYAVFLGDLVLQGLDWVPGAKELMNTWVMSGILGVCAVTTTMGAFGIMVDDRDKQISKDFLSAPIRRRDIAGGYLLSSFLIGMVMGLVTFLLCEGYIILQGGSLLPLLAMLKVVGILALSVLASTAMVYFFVSFFKSQNAFATASTILGTLIGFVTGVYIPIGDFPEAVQNIIKFFPLSHAGALFRQVMMEDAMAASLKGAPESTVAEFKESLGVVFTYGGNEAAPLVSVLVLLFTAVVFYLLSVAVISRKKRA